MTHDFHPPKLTNDPPLLVKIILSILAIAIAVPAIAIIIGLLVWVAISVWQDIFKLIS